MKVYQLLGDIKLEFGDSHVTYATDTYLRELDLETATVRTKYVIEGIEFTREYFSSNPDQVLVTKLSTKKPGSLSFTLYFDSKMHHSSHAKGGGQIIIEGSCPGKRIPPRVYANDNPKGIQFSAILDLQIGGEKGVIETIDGKKLKVQDSDWAVLLLSASSSFDGPFVNPADSTKDPAATCLTTINSAKKIPYSEIYARHLEDYQKLFGRVTLQLSKNVKAYKANTPHSTACGLHHLEKNGNAFASKTSTGLPKSSMPGRNDSGLVSTADRVKTFKIDEDPSLVTLLFHYGRYLLISCSRPGTQIANLQGIWNKDIEPPWDCAQHLNINLQMNYWPALPCDLSECQEPLFDYISSLAVNGSKTSKVNYETGGWVAHQVSDIWAKTSPDRGNPVWALWQMGGAWLCTHLWEQYTFTLDKAFLEKKAYPLLEGCATFLLDWLLEGPGGYLVTNPSTSPEHEFIAPDGKKASVSYSTTMDMAIIKEVFSAMESAAEVLGRSEDDFIKKIKAASLKLYPTKIARDGSIMEWAQDFEDPDVHHRHLSHLFGLFPGHSISLSKTPDLCKAAVNSLYKRGDEGPGWSTVWKMALWARLHSSEHAYKLIFELIKLVDPDHEADYLGGVYSNLFTAHPPFQIDANFGFTAAVAEMLVQSTEKDLFLLPALPRDKWGNGCIEGLKARGGVTVNICWKEGELHNATLLVRNHCATRRLHYHGTAVTAKLKAGYTYTFSKELKCVKWAIVP
ncbi:alpha-L-fucosidase 2-like isoform X2 [Nymphaea colorata]|uniref:alpha-L-fucosidase 2-like isoform X2 n=1 Tax=Nymphaea colorata TaxID=210225 RepID=UPI00129E35C9|nr:alpha-L-fucosidase 2-like isoform X2 [Nymphaea colorata]